MLDQYYGVKELYEVVLKAKVPMQFGKRNLETGEPVLYFEKVNLALLSEKSKVILARGGWNNMPRVVWEDRSEVQFTITEGVMSAISLGLLLSAQVTSSSLTSPVLVPNREGPFILDNNNELEISHAPDLNKKVFIYEYTRDVAQRKVYGHITNQQEDGTTTIQVHDPDITKQFIVDYYYKYQDESLIYTIEKERFTGLFSLEGKFYAKDENEGINYINLIYMPKVRVVSDINLRLGERADPTTSVFNIIGLPETTEDSNNLILRTIRLGTVD